MTGLHARAAPRNGVDAGKFIAKYWGKPGGAERATYQMFLTELALLLGADTPDPGEGGTLGDYQFEGPVSSEAVFFSKHNKRIDLYKRGHFILEAKQSQLKDGDSLPEEAPETLDAVTDLFGNVTGYQAPKGKRAKKYDRLMADARVQAERYSLALPSGHKPPPFLIIADIGRTFELYFDWTGDGRGYGFFPDKQNYRIPLTALGTADHVGSTEKTAQELLTAIWSEPDSIDPRRKAVAVTRDIAERLSRVAEALEADQRESNPGKADFEVARGIENTSLFLMRVLFCMFAEDVELLEKGSFTRFLDEARSKSKEWWTRGLKALWEHMNQADEHNRFWSYGDTIVRHFNGNLFSSAQVYDLPQEFRGELFEAAKRDWRAVEPAIFGTLLEQALTKAERAKLGAHYTPRPYVQRLVNATIGDVLTTEWHEVRDRVRALMNPPSPSGEGAGVGAVPGAPPYRPHPNPSPQGEGLKDEARQVLTDFHNRLADQRILDPACGTGNFLYVAMELLLQLESEALELAAELGEALTPAVHPNQFLGLELNPRAAVIAELVLWIGWLRHRLANHPEAIGDPVLPTLHNINFGTHGGYDAVLRRTATGEPDVENPMQPDWPEADFIVGNPPFIGKGAEMRETLTSAYVEALWKANPRVPKSADFVMQWWDRAAHALVAEGTRLRRFGFVTTNSITQTFSRRVIEAYLSSPSKDGEGDHPQDGGGVTASTQEADPSTASGGPPPPAARGEDCKLSLLLAIPDHPWTKATKDAAAVRIAMTVAARGQRAGTLVEIAGESGLETDKPVLTERDTAGRINSDLSVGADVTTTVPLRANEGLSCNGMMLAAQGFVLTRRQATHLAKSDNSDLETSLVIRHHIGGNELTQKPRDGFVVDFFGLSERDARGRFPAAYQWVLERVKPERDLKADKAFREKWWLFGRTRPDIRKANNDLDRYIATTRTAKHRIFQFLDARVLSNHEVVVISTGEAFHLGVLSSQIHTAWALNAGGTLEDRPRYNKASTFDPFPFPDATPEQRAAIAELAEELDATRKLALAEVPGLTMTELYNLRALHRSGTELTPRQQDRIREARAWIVDRLHQQIDDAVADAYGWPRDLPPAEIVTRLVALNHERAAEEKAGTIRWLRPEYQIPRFGTNPA